MWSLTFVFVVSVLFSAAAITLPNGFTFDEKQFLNLKSRAISLLDQQCENKFSRCADDCETPFYCDENNNAIEDYPCENLPYCVKGSLTCSGTFPMNNPTCLNKALNNFMCTADDPTDCAKYHVCNGSSHSIVECTASHTYSIDPIIREEQYYNPDYNPGNGEFACHFQPGYGACLCDYFRCNGNTNQFIFGYNDRFHYAYCLEVGPIKKVLMFKCPAGTAHNFKIDAVTNSVVCLPV